MTPSKTATLAQTAESYKDQRQAAKQRDKARAVEWKAEFEAKKKVAPGFFDPNKYSLWI